MGSRHIASICALASILAAAEAPAGPDLRDTATKPVGAIHGPRARIPAATGSATTPAIHPSRERWDPRFEAILRAMSDVDSATVMRLVAKPAPARDSAALGRAAWEMRVGSQSRRGDQWAARFAKALGAGTSYSAEGVCRPEASAGAPEDSLVLSVRFGELKGAPVALVWLQKGCAQLEQGGAPAGCVDITRVSRTLLDLAREALPEDEMLRRASPRGEEATRQKAPPPAPPTRITPPESGELPAFGKYVEVEELPEALTKVQPVYPPGADGAEGTVVVQALVGKDGRVKDTRIVKSVPHLDAAAQDAVRQWTFKPAMAKGKPVAVWVAVPVRFSIP